MKYTKVQIESLGYELAPVVVSSEELEERLASLYKQRGMPCVARGQHFGSSCRTPACELKVQ